LNNLVQTKIMDLWIKIIVRVYDAIKFVV